MTVNRPDLIKFVAYAASVKSHFSVIFSSFDVLIPLRALRRIANRLTPSIKMFHLTSHRLPTCVYFFTRTVNQQKPQQNTCLILKQIRKYFLLLHLHSFFFINFLFVSSLSSSFRLQKIFLLFSNFYLSSNINDDEKDDNEDDADDDDVLTKGNE